MQGGERAPAQDPRVKKEKKSEFASRLTANLRTVPRSSVMLCRRMLNSRSCALARRKPRCSPQSRPGSSLTTCNWCSTQSSATIRAPSAQTSSSCYAAALRFRKLSKPSSSSKQPCATHNATKHSRNLCLRRSEPSTSQRRSTSPGGRRRACSRGLARRLRAS